MDEPSMESYLTGRTPEPRAPKSGRALIPAWLTTALTVLLLLAVGYLLYDSYQFRQLSQAEFARIGDQIQALENRHRAGEAKLSNIEGELNETQEAVGSTRTDLRKTAEQIQAENARSRAQLSQEIAAKADQQAVQAFRQEADTKITQVSSEVGGVKTEVGAVKTDLATTRRDLEGTQRQLIDVTETLNAAVAKNAAELAILRRKGERDFFEFTIPKKNVLTKVEDIRVVLKKTDTKKGKYNLEIIVDDSRLEKKDRTINEPVQFLVGRNRVRYELVVNWVQKDNAGGYLSIPKDRGLAAER